MAKSKYSAEVHRVIVEKLAAGNFLADAAALAGVSPETVRGWVRAGKSGDAELAVFAADVDRAMAEATETSVNAVRTSGDPRWHAWWLERARPKDWGQRIELRARERAVDEVLDKLRDVLDEATYQRALLHLAGEEAPAEEH